MQFAAAVSEHPVTATAIGETAGEILDRLDSGPALVTVFVTPHHAGALEDAALALQTILDPQCLIGCAAASVLGNGREIENGPGVVVWAGRVGPVLPVCLSVATGLGPEPATVLGWPARLPFAPSLLVLLADPFSFPADQFLAWLAHRHPGLAVVGGNASAARGPGGNRLAVGGDVATTGAVGALIGPGAEVATVVSQGCRPIGRQFVVTKAEGNIVYELGGVPAYDRLVKLARTELTDPERAGIGDALFLGVVVDEYREDHGRGDLLVRPVLGADTGIGAIAVDGPVAVGTTVQYQLRDAATADEDLRLLLRGQLAEGALAFTDIGRGQQLFSEPHHDAIAVSDTLDGTASAGFFAAGEFGPVGGQNFSHAFAAAIALLRVPAPQSGKSGDG